MSISKDGESKLRSFDLAVQPEWVPRARLPCLLQCLCLGSSGAAFRPHIQDRAAIWGTMPAARNRNFTGCSVLVLPP